MSELRALRQRKDELENHLATLQDSRKQLMAQLEGLMKMLKVCLIIFLKKLLKIWTLWMSVRICPYLKWNILSYTDTPSIASLNSKQFSTQYKISAITTRSPSRQQVSAPDAWRSTERDAQSPTAAATAADTTTASATTNVAKLSKPSTSYVGELKRSNGDQRRCHARLHTEQSGAGQSILRWWRCQVGQGMRSLTPDLGWYLPTFVKLYLLTFYINKGKMANTGTLTAT